MRLRYTGPAPVTFMTGVGEVAPGDEFTVADEDAPGYLARADVVKALPSSSAPAGRRKSAKGAGQAPEADAAPVPEEETGDAVPDVR